MKSAKGPQSPQKAPSSRLIPSDLVELQGHLREIQLAIARRAYELFEGRGREHGHDLEDWFKAESELLRPLPFATSEREGWLSVQADVHGFAETELKAGVEPRRVIILGKKEPGITEAGKGAIPTSTRQPDQILRVIDLPLEIEPSGAIVELKAGVLGFELPKAAERAALSEDQAA
jgi:HSP20 family protein